MSVCYYKRYRMVIDLGRSPLPPQLPAGYFWVPWHDALIEFHAQVKFLCFHDQLDARIFPCLSDRGGCWNLMREISNRRGFLPEATWLVGDETSYVGTVQGVIDHGSVGMIQNLGVIPQARGKGLGTALLLKALEGFRSARLRQGMLEVTAKNTAAVRLYRRLGFRRTRTLYRAVQAA
jgi:ribosomal protein S18 acetylase RimI-like enzyme